VPATFYCPAQILHEEGAVDFMLEACLVDRVMAPDCAADASHMMRDKDADRAGPATHHLVDRVAAFQFTHFTPVADLVSCRSTSRVRANSRCAGANPLRFARSRRGLI
jgi:hypothetical protein